MSMDRRQFLKVMGIAGGGLVTGISLSACSPVFTLPNTINGSLQPNAILQITPANKINFYLPRAEMGQGVFTGLTTLIAEELEVSPANINIVQTGFHPDYANPDYGMQVTGGSNSIRSHFIPLRQLAANTRSALQQAAAQRASVSVADTTALDGQITANGQTYTYGDLAEAASALPFPENTPLKNKQDFTYIGKHAVKLDAKAKSTGNAKFGIDVNFPGLHRAVLKRCPQAGGKVKKFDDTAAKAMPGITDIVEIHNGVAVVAEHYYQAKAAVEKLEVEWLVPEKLSGFSSASSEVGNGKQLFSAALTGEDAETAHEEGERFEPRRDSSLAADYWAPYLAHATMEPMNCTARFSGEKLDIWTSTQNPELVAGLGAFYGELPVEDVTVHAMFVGGGFGRRGAADYVAEAVAIARQTGKPIQLIWSREDDMRHGLYRPAAMARFQIDFDEDQSIRNWLVRRVGPNILPYILDESLDTLIPAFLPNSWIDRLSKLGHHVFDGLVVDETGVEGLFEDYDASYKKVEHVTVDPGIPVGFWRSVGHSYSGFFKECMMDECASFHQIDPVTYRLKHLQSNPRLANTLTVAAEKSGWHQTPEPGHHLGVASHVSFSSYVTEIAEVSVANNNIIVHRITCVVDCGLAVNPAIVRAQMESGIIYGLSAALVGEITLTNGAIDQSNFHDYPVLRMNQTPEIDVIIIDSDEAPTGVGEPGLPPVAAAVANAVFAATGKRLRSLPLALS